MKCFLRESDFRFVCVLCCCGGGSIRSNWYLRGRISRSKFSHGANSCVTHDISAREMTKLVQLNSMTRNFFTSPGAPHIHLDPHKFKFAGFNFTVRRRKGICGIFIFPYFFGAFRAREWKLSAGASHEYFIITFTGFFWSFRVFAESCGSWIHEMMENCHRVSASLTKRLSVAVLWPLLV